MRPLVRIALTGAVLTLVACGSSSKSPKTVGRLAAEAKSAATGDIPDNQAFLTYRDAAGHWSMKYPEGWTQSGSGSDVRFTDKDNFVHVHIVKGAATGGGPLKKTVLHARTKPNPVTGKTLPLLIDRYVIAHAGRLATVDLGTPVGVDNVDAYKLMIESFKWR